MPLNSVSVILVEPVAVFEFGVAVEVFGLDRTDDGLSPFDFRVCSATPGVALQTKNLSPFFKDARTTIGIRTARWKYIHYNDGDGELYDLQHDPNELYSHYNDPAYATIQAELAKVWLAHKDCAGASCLVPLPRDLQLTPSQTRVMTDLESVGVQQRYGYYR